MDIEKKNTHLDKEEGVLLTGYACVLSAIPVSESFLISEVWGANRSNVTTSVKKKSYVECLPVGWWNAAINLARSTNLWSRNREEDICILILHAIYIYAKTASAASNGYNFEIFAAAHEHLRSALSPLAAKQCQRPPFIQCLPPLQTHRDGVSVLFPFRKGKQIPMQNPQHFRYISELSLF